MKSLKHLALAAAFTRLAWLSLFQLANAETATGFSHTATASPQGYYLPVNAARFGKTTVKNVELI